MQNPTKNLPTTPARPQATGGTLRHRLQIGALPLLALAAVFLWTAPARREKALKQESLALLEDAARDQPDNPRVAYYLGLRLREAGRLADAQAAFKHAAEGEIDDEDIWLAWAGTQQGSQQVFDILSLFLAKHPRSARAHLALAQCYQENRAYKRAYEEAGTAARLNPSDADAWRLTGVNGMAWEQNAAAMDALRRAVALQPGDWRNRLALGDALSQTGSRADALACFREAARLAPKEAVAHLSLGWCLLRHAATPADFEAARQSLLASAALAPDLPLVRLLLGQTYARQRDWKSARESLEIARQLAPNDNRVAFELARVYDHLGDVGAAHLEHARHQRILAYKAEIRLLQESIVQNRTDPKLRLKLARRYAAHGDYAEAARQYRQILGRTPGMEIARQELTALGSRATPPTADPANPLPKQQP